MKDVPLLENSGESSVAASARRSSISKLVRNTCPDVRRISKREARIRCCSSRVHHHHPRSIDTLADIRPILLPINRDLFSTSGVSLRRRSRSAGNESTPDTFSTIDATTRRSGGRTSSPNLPARNVPLHSSLFSSSFARSTQHVLVISRGAYEIF